MTEMENVINEIALWYEAFTQYLKSLDGVSSRDDFEFWIEESKPFKKLNVGYTDDSHIGGLTIFQAALGKPQIQFAVLVLDGSLFELTQEHYWIGSFSDYIRIVYSSSDDLVISGNPDDKRDVSALATSLIDFVRCMKPLTEINLLSVFGLLNRTDFDRIRSELSSTSKGDMVIFDLLLSQFVFE